MARTKREKSGMGIYHVLMRATDKLFFSDEDYAQFVQLLGTYFTGGTQKLLAYSLDEGKIHLLVHEGESELSKILKPLCTSYARYINRTYDRSGKLFYDRYKSEPISDSAYLLSCVLYIHTQNGRTSAYEYEGESAVCDTSLAYAAAGGETEYKKAADAELRVMCMDDYEHMEDSEVDRYVRLLSGKSIDEIKLLEKKERTSILKSLTNTKWVSARRLGLLLDAGRIAASPAEKPKKTSSPKKAPAKPRSTADSGLSVWLL